MNPRGLRASGIAQENRVHETRATTKNGTRGAVGYRRYPRNIEILIVRAPYTSCEGRPPKSSLRSTSRAFFRSIPTRERPVSFVSDLDDLTILCSLRPCTALLLYKKKSYLLLYCIRTASAQKQDCAANNRSSRQRFRVHIGRGVPSFF